MPPIGQGLPQGPRDQRGNVEEKHCPTRSGASPWEENTVGLAGLEGYEEE
jgi:hypothetical protein